MLRYVKEFLALFFLVLMVGCSKAKESSSETGLDADFLQISLAAEVRSLDPRYGTDDQSQHAIRMLFDGLMSFDLKRNLIPSTAKKYEISSDLKTYTFYLRPSKWNNGKDVTAYDFEYTWKKVINSTCKGTALHNYYPIKNVQAVLQGEKNIEDVGIKALNEKMLIVQLEHPTPYFLESLTNPCFFPVNAEIDKKNPNWAKQNGKAFVCNGPFYLKEHRHNNEILVLKNPSFWDAEHVRLPGIKIAIIKEPLTQLSMYQKNQLAWLGKPLHKMPLDAIPTLKRRGKLYHIPSLGVYWYFINTQAFPFTNKKLRQAFAYAINRQEITTHVFQEGETPAQGILPPGLEICSDAYFPDNCLEKARALFSEALQELGITKEQLPPITISYNSSEDHQRTAQVVQEQWHKAFGIKVNLEQREWKVHYQKLIDADFQIGGMRWDSFIRDPMYIMQTFRFRADGINMSHWEHQTYQDLLNRAEKEPDKEKRRQIIYEAEKFLMEEMPVIPVYFGTISFAKKKYLKDVYVSELYMIDFRRAYVDKKKDKRA
jgi:oligopeptide transport system substrate-binding protein